MMSDINLSPEIIKRWQEQGEWECKVCGCTELNACEGGCYWVEDNLCSSCATPQQLLQKEIDYYCLYIEHRTTCLAQEIASSQNSIESLYRIREHLFAIQNMIQFIHCLNHKTDDSKTIDDLPF